MGERLGTLRDRSASVHVTEDYEAGWTRTFGVTGAPATFLLDPRGAFVWEHPGPPDVSALTAALDKHTPRGGRMRLRRTAPV